MTGYPRAAGIAVVLAAVAGAAAQPEAQERPWSRARGSESVRSRSALCEACGAAEGQEFSHRIAASRGGTWAPSNGVRACHRCHRWLEAHPTWAGEGGWHIRRDPRPPEDVPVFLVTVLQPLGAWHLLLDDGGREEVYPDEFGLPEVPAHLPPGHVRLQLRWTEEEDVEAVRQRAEARLAAFRARLEPPTGGRPLPTVPWVEP